MGFSHCTEQVTEKDIHVFQANSVTTFCLLSTSSTKPFLLYFVSKCTSLTTNLVTGQLKYTQFIISI